MVAKTWGAGIAERIGKPLPDCGRCRRPDSTNERKRWGCDSETKKPVFTTGCSRCFGSDPECPDCEDGVIAYKRCPTAVIESYTIGERRAAGRSLRAYIQLDSRSVMPYAGGFEEQTNQFAQIVDVIDSERGRWDKFLEEKRERDRKRTKP